MGEIFRYQGWHFLSVFVLVALTQRLIANGHGALWGIGTNVWSWIALLIPILHQIYVWLVWRLELHRNTFTSRFGVSRAFRMYATGFSILFTGRLVSIVLLALSDKNSLLIHSYLVYILETIITSVVFYLFYSVKKYFTFERAFGIDHFDKNYSVPYVQGGIFRFTNNGMYVYGLMILYLPGLFLGSKAALIAALFNHLYIWVHYFCTERPDMKVIYGKLPDH